MNKKEACKLLDVNMKELANIISIKYDSLRSLKTFSEIHLNLIQWELDKRFIQSVLDQAESLDDIAKELAAKSERIEEALKR